MQGLTRQIRDWGVRLKRDTFALWIAARDHRTPLAAKILAGVVAAYAFSPIDLIPDFIPVLGYVDDLILLPLGITFAIRMIPRTLMDEFRAAADQRTGRPKSRIAAALIIVLWLTGLILFACWAGLGDMG